MMEAIIDSLIDAVCGETEEATGNSLNDTEMGENDNSQVTIRDEDSKHLQPKLTQDGYICPVVSCIDHNKPKKRKSHVVEHIGYVHTDQLQYQFTCGKCGVGWYKRHDCYRHELACQGPGIKMPGRPLWRPPSSALAPPPGITLKECRVHVKRLKLKADSEIPRGPDSQELVEETTDGRPKRIRAKPERLDCNYLV